jgi:hypothetical protein
MTAAVKWVYVLVAPMGARVAHVVEHDPGGSWGTAACGKAGELHRIDRGSHVYGGLTVCKQCRRRSPMARTLAAAVADHRARFGSSSR